MDTLLPMGRIPFPRVYLYVALGITATLLFLHQYSASRNDGWAQRTPFAYTNSKGSTVSEFSEYEYWKEEAGNVAPQPANGSAYSDRLLTHPEDSTAPRIELPVSKQKAVVIPTYEGHFHEALANLRSLQCLCTDLQEFDIVIILSNDLEVKAFREMALKYLDTPCVSPFGIHQIPDAERLKPRPNLHFVNLFDILPQNLRAIPGVAANDTSPLMAKVSKFKYQGIKKLQATRYFSYKYVLFVDSEGVAVQPFSLQEVFEGHIKEPIVWRSRGSRYDARMNPIMGEAARVLGRSMDSFGKDYWLLESLQWIIEREILEDLVEWVERAHGRNFWDVFLGGDDVFEVALYYLHIVARKAETTNSIFSKFKVLESEREMIRYGLAPAFRHREEYNIPGGFMEYVGSLLKEPGIQPNLSAFLGRYHIRLIRLRELDLVDRETMEKFLLETPISMLVSGTPDVHRWWNPSFNDPEPSENGKEWP